MRLAEARLKLIRFGFRLLYNEFAFSYDTVSSVVSLGEWRCWVQASLKHLPTDTTQPVLELAHGTGNLQIDLFRAGYRAVGCDLSPAMGRIARRKLAGQGVPARLARARAQRLPFAAAAFGAVVSTFPTDFIVARETLDEVYRVLQPGGVFVIVPNAQLSGGGAAAQGIEALYRITGQRGGGLSQERIKALFAPFVVEVAQERCARGVVSVIIARKML